MSQHIFQQGVNKEEVEALLHNEVLASALLKEAEAPSLLMKEGVEVTTLQRPLELFSWVEPSHSFYY